MLVKGKHGFRTVYFYNSKLILQKPFKEEFR